ncbi:uncharacterized protein K444DRAFT_690361 [Hyaloscypha bicolor E]|uniref:Heterokaryon incompatibility domain-containing protein n=1 Tax=Hyaloscypha bicolor E TaxID=1095630 RepID=A0A2J6TX36_9HELO|nr:uncharacterized protein K444DRAFT_690361 [Hyaloscypha bicolor E]PMD67565.1 hypothetical protein K444DRAFT_690361 [Hyaloscypha bicolor E]
MAYTPLNNSHNVIRLLHLKRASKERDEIQARSSLALLDDRPQYEALSYAWGDANDTRPVEIEDCGIPITKNLYLALKYLRLNNQERVLWVDALYT